MYACAKAAEANPCNTEGVKIRKLSLIKGKYFESPCLSVNQICY